MLKSLVTPFNGIVALFLLLVFFTFDAIEEDAYIYFRFAANIANGFGYVFNQGGPPVESGSSLVWQLMLVPLYWLDPDLLLSVKVMSILFAILSLWLLRRITGLFTQDKLVACIPSLWLVCSYPFYLWSHMGLETPLFLLLCLWFLYCLLDEDVAPYWPFAAALVVFGRPEGFMLCAALIPFLFQRNNPVMKLPRIAIFLGLVVLGELFRLLYFADLVPHSFYNKISFANRSGLRDISALAGIPFLLLISASLGFIWHYRTITKAAWIMAIALAVAIVWGAVGQDMKPYDRSFVVALALIYLGCVALITSLVKARLTVKKLLFPLAIVFSFIALFFSSITATFGAKPVPAFRHVTNYFFTSPIPLTQRLGHLFTPGQHLPRDIDAILYTPGDFLYDNHQVISGEFIANNYPKNISVVYDQMGQTPWYAGADKVFIDTLGLIDLPVGYHLFNEKLEHSTSLNLFNTLTAPVRQLFGGDDRSVWERAAVLDYIFDQQPELIMIHGLILVNPESMPSAVKNDPRLAANYTLRYGVNWTMVYERNDLLTSWEDLQLPANCICLRIRELADGSLEAILD